MNVAEIVKKVKEKEKINKIPLPLNWQLFISDIAKTVFELKFVEIEEQIRGNIEKIARELIASIYEKIKGEKGDPGEAIRGEKGDPGYTPTEEEIINLIKPLIPEAPTPQIISEEEIKKILIPLIPKVQNGKTPTKDELLKLILPLIPKVKPGKTPTKKELLALIKPLIPKIDPKKLDENVKNLIVQEVKRTSKQNNKMIHGGGLSYSNFYAETPSGSIDGNNKIFSVTRNINKIILFAINGQIIHPSEYTVSTNKITFGTALDSSLSTTSFTLLYV